MLKIRAGLPARFGLSFTGDKFVSGTESGEVFAISLEEGLQQYGASERSDDRASDDTGAARGDQSGAHTRKAHAGRQEPAKSRRKG
ncbi:hypothetical protein [Lacisediminimonas profundi]|uniref:hypothetical protein n=1 Tax=Lacisediminimonas profundi TaxID=2603856 RepID=UPI0019D4F7E9|nr:hypothetical protein [Lacisediminimonas profundi]